MSELFTVLAKDSNCRNLGIKTDLFKLSDLKNDSSWDYSYPTLCEEYNYYNKKSLLRDIKKFQETFSQQVYPLNNVDMTNLLIAGGCVRSILTSDSINDVDIFIYGISSPKNAQKRVEKLILDIKEHLEEIKSEKYLEKEMNKIRSSVEDKAQADKYISELKRKNKHLCNEHQNTNIGIYNNGNTVTMMVGGMQIQVILRLYETKSEILHGFDLGSSAVGYDGINVLFTSLSKFCYENRINVFDHTRRSTTYEQRLVKYLGKGFDIVLPNMDISKLRTEYHKYNLCEVCTLPYITFSYGRVKGNMIYVNRFFNKFNQEMSDYSFYESLCEGEDDGEGAYGLLHHNLKELISGTNNIVYRMSLSKELEIYKSIDDARKKWKLNFSGKIFNWGCVEYIYNNLQKNLNSSAINIRDLQKYFNVFDDLKEFVNDLYLSNKTFEEKQKVLDDLISKQVKALHKAVDDLEKSSLNWITENPTTQLTSSINPVLEEANEWYGDLYNELEEVKKSKSKKSKSDSDKNTDLNDLQFKQILSINDMIKHVQYSKELNVNKDAPKKASFKKFESESESECDSESEIQSDEEYDDRGSASPSYDDDSTCSD